MKKLALAMLIAAPALTGCVSTPMYSRTSPLIGGLYTGVQGFQSVTENPIGPKQGKSCAMGFWEPFTIIPLSIAFGDASAASAAAKGSMTKLSVVDEDELGILGLFGQHCTVAHDGGDAAGVPVGAPPPPPNGAQSISGGISVQGAPSVNINGPSIGGTRNSPPPPPPPQGSPPPPPPPQNSPPPPPPGQI